MSFWTSTCVTFKVDRKLSVRSIENLVGHIQSFDDMLYECGVQDDIVPDDGQFFLPRGSEGTLDIYVRESTDKRTVFTVTGGLRDRSNTDDVVSWFNSIVEKNEKRRYDQPIILSAVGYTSADNGISEETVKLRYKCKLTSEEKARFIYRDFFRTRYKIEDCFRKKLRKLRKRKKEFDK